MLDKLLGKKEKGMNIFNIPDRKYCHQSKKLAKMDKKDLLEVVGDMEKYIGNLCEKLEGGKKECEKYVEKSDQLQEKLSLVNGEMLKINNEHEELTIKFSNLQVSLEVMIKEKDEMIDEWNVALEQHGIVIDKGKNWGYVMQIYKDKVSLCEKIGTQNKNLKQKINELQDEMIQLKQNQKVSYEEKKVMKEVSQEHMEEIQEQLKTMRSECQKYRDELHRKEIQIENIQMKTNTYEQEITNLLKLNAQISKQNQQIIGLNDELKNKKGQIQNLLAKIDRKNEEFEIKQKKHESELNQERIKMDGMKRQVFNLEQKVEENKKVMDEMYEKKMIQDGKGVQMEKKLKEYKHLIQYLRKQKIQLEKTFESKIKGFEEMVAHEPDQSEEENREEDVEEKQQNGNNIRGENEIQAKILNNKIMQLEEEMIIYKQENFELKKRNQELNEKNGELEKNVKMLKEKREEVMKEIKKITEKGLVGDNEEVKELKKQIYSRKEREKKIAEKAVRGFDILYKLHHQLYKDFLKGIVTLIQKDEVKDMQTSINNIIKKTTDMRDIFTDYL